MAVKLLAPIGIQIRKKKCGEDCELLIVIPFKMYSAL